MIKSRENFVSEYLRELKISGKDTGSIKTASRILFEYIDLNSLDYLTLSIADCQNFQTYLVTLTDENGDVYYTKATVLNIIGVLTTFYTYLKKRSQIYANPFLEVKRVKRSNSLPKNILDEESMNTFLSHLRDFHQGKNITEKKQFYRAHVIGEVMYSTGLRVSELVKLKVSDIDFDRGTLRIQGSKNKQVRDGILNEYALKVLKIYVEKTRKYLIHSNGNDSLLFGAGRSLTLWINDFISKESKKKGFGSFTSHNFRHAVGYHLLRGGCDIRYIQEILGHEKLSSTQVYTKVHKEDLRNVIDKYHPRMWRK